MTSFGKARKRMRTNRAASGRPTGRSRFNLRAALRRNRAGVVALMAVLGFVAVLTGFALADGVWFPHVPGVTGDSNPTARFGHAAVWDEANNEMVMFGGFGTPNTLDPSKIAALDETYTLIGGEITRSTWTNREPLHRPSPRGFASMAYDAAHKNVVLFGGSTYRANHTASGPLAPTDKGTVYGDTWIWDGKDWTLRNPPGPTPPPRLNASMTYDAHRKVVVLYGGRNVLISPTNPDGAPMNDTWTWDGVAWKQHNVSVSAPSARYGAAMVYDLCRAETVLFGGTKSGVEANPVSYETWIWDGASWRQKTIVVSLNQPGVISDPTFDDPNAPPARYGGSMVYSTDTGRVLLYGGFFASHARSQPSVATDPDVWTWNGTAWEKALSEATQLLIGANSDFHVSPLPPPRGYSSFVYVPHANFSWAFGGTPADLDHRAGDASNAVPNPVPHLILPDLWAFSIQQRGLGAATLTPRLCENPVPIPPDDDALAAAGKEAPKQETRKEIREIGRLPVLLGTDPRVVPAGSPKPPCMRRPNQESTGNSQLVTDPKRNRVYQFFVCQPPTEAERAQGRKDYLLIEVYHGDTLKPLARTLVPMVFGQLMHDSKRGRFLIRTQKYQSPSYINDVYVLSQELIEAGQDPVINKITLPNSVTAGKAIYQAMSFFNHPATGRAKLLFSIIGEYATSQTTPGGAASSVIQLDLEDNRSDWSRRADGCQGGVNASLNSPSLLTGLFRVADRVYFSCQFGNRVAVVRFPVVEEPSDTNPNDREGTGILEVFPSPVNLQGAVWGDAETERMLLSPPSGNTFSSSVWVFDGPASRFVGRVGLPSDHNTLSFSSTGFDSETGRFYVQARDYTPSGYKIPVQGGLFVLDSRLTPAPQAINFSQFSHNSTVPIATMPSNGDLPRRVFLRRAAQKTPSVYEGDPDYEAQAKNTADASDRYPDGQRSAEFDEMFYLVLADEMSVPEQPSVSQQDRLTLPVKEDPKKTEASFEAEGSGYGIRLKSIGGVITTLRPFPQMGDGAQFLSGLVLDDQRPLFAACLYPDRELVSGSVPQALLSSLSTSARSSGLEVDSTTKVDLAGPSARCLPTGVSPNSTVLPAEARSALASLWPLIPWAVADQVAGSGSLSATRNPDGTLTLGQDPQGASSETHNSPLGSLTTTKDQSGSTNGAKITTISGTSWDKRFKEVSCVGTNEGNHQVSEGTIQGQATCNQQQGLAQASAFARPIGTGGDQDAQAFSIAEGYSDVIARRDPEKGVVVTSIAIAKGIKLGPLYIARVESKATSWSNGRPHQGSRATFQRKICGVIAPGLPAIPDSRMGPDGCLTPAGEKWMADNWNSRFTINSKIFFPTPDPDYLQGSKGGYTSGVVKLLADEVENRLLINESRKEVPALVIEFYKESPTSPGRQILELAATRAVTSYGLQCQSHLMYSSSQNECIDIPDDLFEEESFEEEETAFSSDDDSAFNTYDQGDGGWTPVATGPSGGLALGKRIGRFIENLPLVRQLPIRQMGEALLAGSVWLLLGMPLFLASRRFALNFARRS